MLKILFEDTHIIVVEKPVGIESQTARGFEPDMVSEIKKHINNLSTNKKEPYVGVIHRLDKPVGGVMVYAKTQSAAAFLSKQVQSGEMKKKYYAVICGKPVDIVGNFVDYLLKDAKSNYSNIVEKGTSGAKKAELSYRVLDTINTKQELSLVEVTLLTGRHHQIRVQFAGHGMPLYGDNKYNSSSAECSRRENVALAACELSFMHPETKKEMTFYTMPKGAVFKQFNYNIGGTNVRRDRESRE